MAQTLCAGTGFSRLPFLFCMYQIRHGCLRQLAGSVLRRHLGRGGNVRHLVHDVLGVGYVGGGADLEGQSCPERQEVF